ncbi:C40 family peptidase [Halomonas korlensis]|uniref:NlpC/P60 family protein n=1 Tax=Halomonas korlensis TaxID=463301 RepID=A0A1I7GVX7_9GAMM|nr:C40 family peptidase [Halomonas korlensis]SFU52607.1 NlpC/P60 family protein [Halomonas korlensis]
MPDCLVAAYRERPPAGGFLWPVTRLLALSLGILLLAGCAGRELTTRDDAGELSLDRALILAEAKRTLGTPYRFGGASESGLDCSGLVQLSYSRAGISVPRTSHQQFATLPRVDAARPGDLLFFDTARGGKASHVGIYLGGGQMIHAPGRGRHVTTTSVALDYWQERFLGAAAPAP